jgi:heme oxygenase (biliverdin-IX-beta and delta-forming)
MADVLQLLRAGTATEHAEVERTLDLMDAGLDRPRLVDVLDRLHAFWTSAEAGLDAWAERHPADARAVDWPRRRRARLFAEDLHALDAGGGGARPQLPGVDDTDQALGRLYVLEGATLGGTFIDRHLARLPQLSGVRVRAFCPYGPETGAMWHAFRRVTRERVASGGNAAVVVTAARQTFGALAAWCRG